MSSNVFRCQNCRRPVGVGEPQMGDLLICPRCARAINQDYGKVVFREDYAAFYEQMNRPRPPEQFSWRPCPSGLTPLPPPRSTTRRRSTRWMKGCLKEASFLFVCVVLVYISYLLIASR